MLSSPTMGFKAMDPELTRALLKGHADVITPAAEMETEVYKAARCPVCGTRGADKVVPPPKIIREEDGDEIILRAPFSESSPLILGHGKCSNCGTEYSVETGVIIEQSEPVITDPGFTDE